jgi:hypothetical protein
LRCAVVVPQPCRVIRRSERPCRVQKDTAIAGIGVTEAASPHSSSRRRTATSRRTSSRCSYPDHTIPLARFTDHIVSEREKRERAQAF